MFEQDVTLKGKHATYVKFLSKKSKLLGDNTIKNGAAIFERYIDVYMIAPLIGVMKGLREDEDKSNDDKANILASAFSNTKKTLDFIFKLVMLNDNSKGFSADQKVDWIFRENGDYELFMQYVRGGITYLYEYFIDGASTKDDYYEKIILLLDDIQLEYNGNYDDILNSLMK